MVDTIQTGFVYVDGTKIHYGGNHLHLYKSDGAPLLTPAEKFPKHWLVKYRYDINHFWSEARFDCFSGAIIFLQFQARRIYFDKA